MEPAFLAVASERRQAQLPRLNSNEVVRNSLGLSDTPKRKR